MQKLRKHPHLPQDPVRDWLVVLTLAVLVFIVMVVWHLWTFSIIASGGTLGKGAVTTSPIFDRSSLDTIHRVFSARDEEHDKYVTGVYRYADPSQ